MLLIVVPVLVVAAIAYWYVGRHSRPTVSPDLRRADDAQLQEMPADDEVQARIADAFGETYNPN